VLPLTAADRKQLQAAQEFQSAALARAAVSARSRGNCCAPHWVQRLQLVADMPRQRGGFTLIELMIVITIMGTMAAMIAPGIGEFLADARAAAAAEALARITRHMQARTQQTGLAHLLVFTAETGEGSLGVVRVYEGMNNHCRQTPWIQAINGTVDQGHAPVDVLDLRSGEYNPSVTKLEEQNKQVISVVVKGTVGTDRAAICVEPGGTVWEGVASSEVGAGYVFTKPPSKGSITFTVTRKLNNVVRGVDRVVFFSTSGIARFKF
jgi:prepilin-type N-terminal cleavage/methylation domain-containing protein